MTDDNPRDEMSELPEVQKKSPLQKGFWLLVLIAWIIMMIGFAVEAPRYIHFAQ